MTVFACCAAIVANLGHQSCHGGRSASMAKSHHYHALTRFDRDFERTRAPPVERRKRQLDISSESTGIEQLDCFHI
jgi:hypothetical protein